jgi:four helix bundle protein
MKITRFEDLECWRQAKELMKMIYELIKNKAFSKDYRLRDQITGAGISIMNNIVEGFDSQSNNEFMRFLRIARRSISEVQNCLYIAIEQNYIDQKEFDKTYEHCKRTRKVTDGLLRYLRSKRT